MPRLTNSNAPRAAVIGGGPAGLMAATVLGEAGAAVTLYEQMPSVGRKLLLAGRGGLNLTHSEPLARFMTRYREAEPRLAPLITAFSADDLRAFAHGLGEETFIGSSGRVFPKTFKASPLLRAWLGRLNRLGVTIRPRHQWLDFDTARQPLIRNAAGATEAVACDLLILALGGASWPRLGATGAWQSILAEAGVSIRPLQPANCGFVTEWSEHMARFAGEPLKRIALSFAGETVRGEAIVTKNGLEGGAIYALSAPLREAVARNGEALALIDLRPDLTEAALAAKLARRGPGQSLATLLRKAAGLSPAAVAFLRESAGKDLPAAPSALARLVKAAPLRFVAPQPIARAISSAGGIRLDALDNRQMLKALPGVFAAGEMLDWEAPTGGYLLQACFSTGVAAAKGALAWWAASAGATAASRPEPRP